MHTNLIPIKKEFLEKHGIYLKPSTLFAWHSRGKYNELFVKIGKRLFINFNVFKKIFIEKSEEVGHEEKF